MKINESSLPAMYSKGLYEEKEQDLGAEHTDKIVESLFVSSADLLNRSKSKEYPVAFTLTRVDHQFVAGAIVQYFPNEDASKPGNWSLVWTFNEADIPENARKIDLTDVQCHSYFRGYCGNKWGMIFRNPESLITLHVYLMEELHKWLDENAKEDEEVVLEQDAFFQARVAVENGEKVFAIEPAGEIKMLIKDDASIEK